MAMIAKAGRGVLLIYEMGRSRSGGALLEFHGKHGSDSNETIGLSGEQREYGIGAQILAALNIHSMRILTNHPRKLVALEAYGLKIVEQCPLVSPVWFVRGRLPKLPKFLSDAWDEFR